LAETDGRFIIDPVLMVQRVRLAVSVGLHIGLFCTADVEAAYERVNSARRWLSR